jgi:hypothetical protein
MRQEEAAYLAGLLDGEGTIGVRPRTEGWVVVELGMCMTTPAPLYWAQKVTGKGAIYYRPEKRVNRRDAWFWKVGRCQDIANILREVLPYLQVKAAEARVFLILAHLRLLNCSGYPSVIKEPERRLGVLMAMLKQLDFDNAYDEALDLACYLKQAIVERDRASGPK